MALVDCERGRNRSHHGLAHFLPGDPAVLTLRLDNLGLDLRPKHPGVGRDLAMRATPEQADLLFEPRIELPGSGQERGSEHAPAE